MRFLSRKTAFISGLVLLFFLILFLFLANRNNYLLNKAVRLVSLRLSQFEKISLLRRQDCKFEFKQDCYLVSFFSHQKKAWEIFARHRYPNDIIPSPEGLEIFLVRGRITSFKLKGKHIDLKSYLILNFHHPKMPAKKKGIIFYREGEWRVLG